MPKQKKTLTEYERSLLEMSPRERHFVEKFKRVHDLIARDYNLFKQRDNDYATFSMTYLARNTGYVPSNKFMKFLHEACDRGWLVLISQDAPKWSVNPISFRFTLPEIYDNRPSQVSMFGDAQ